MKFIPSFLALVPFIALVPAHTVFTTLFVNNVSQGDGTCVRMNMEPEQCTNPIPSISSTDMACGIGGQTPVAFTCPAIAGTKLTFLFREWADASQSGSIDPSHQGPCAVYIKSIENSATSAAGPGWVKLWHEGYDAKSSQWCTEKLIKNNGMLTIDLPTGLPQGQYLVRPEVLALQNAAKGDPQFYTGCAQLFIENDLRGPLTVPSEYSVNIPGHVKASDAGLSFDIYTSSPSAKAAYPIPGPRVYTPPSHKGSPPSFSSSSSQGENIAGLVPSNCLLKNANWCGLEVPDYTTEGGCWAASENCWTQADVCYKGAPPSGSGNCRVWEGKCDSIMAECQKGNFVGPPNKGMKLKGTDTLPYGGSVKREQVQSIVARGFRA